MSFRNDLGRQIRVERKKKGLTVNDFAQICGVQKGTISKIETGKATPSLQLLLKICDALERDVLIGSTYRFVERVKIDGGTYRGRKSPTEDGSPNY